MLEYLAERFYMNGHTTDFKLRTQIASLQTQAYFLSSLLSILRLHLQATRLHAFIIICGGKQVEVLDLIVWKEEVVSC